MVTTVSHSEIESYLLCERKHFYGYAMGIQRIEESAALNRGTLGHKVLETYYKTILEGAANIIAENRAMNYLKSQFGIASSDLIDEVAKLVKFHFMAAPFANYKILAVEQEYVLPISDDLAYPFVVDLIVQDPAHKIVLVDHKFTYDFYTQKQMGTMPQIPKYIGALRALGMNVDYGLYNILRYRKMAHPELSDRNQLIEIRPTEARILRTFEECLQAVEQVTERKSHTLLEQSKLDLRISSKMVCDSCSYNNICVAELNQTNPDLVLRSEYKLRERRTFKVEEAK